MLLSKRILFATAAVAVLASFQALSETKSDDVAVTDVHAFEGNWTGEYYEEPPVPADANAFSGFEQKRQHFLDSHSVTTEEVELDENGVELPNSPMPEPSVTPRPGPTFTPWVIPYPGPWSPPYLPFPGVLSSPRPSPSPTASVPKPTDLKPQAMYYYDHGLLQNGTQIESDGRGYVKIFQDRDAASGGRGWGTRAIVTLIRRMAADFSDRYPGRERLQVADIARRSGGRMTHESHQNGLDADIVYIRKNHKEQPAFGGFGKNGFAEQFVVRNSTVRVSKDSHGKTRKIRTSFASVSANFDVDANFHLVLMFSKAGNVKEFFMDKVLIHEMFKFAEDRKIANDPDVREMLMKLVHVPSHADHFHVRLYCQDTDSKCVSSNAPYRGRKAHGKRKGHR